MAKTLRPWSTTSAAAAASDVESGLEAHSTRSAPPACRVRARLAVSFVTCRQAEIRWPLDGWSAANRSRIWPRTGISWAAQAMVRAPSGASLRSGRRIGGLPWPWPVQRYHRAQLFGPRLEVRQGDVGHPVDAEVGHGQRAEHVPVQHGPPQCLL